MCDTVTQRARLAAEGSTAADISRSNNNTTCWQQQAVASLHDDDSRDKHTRTHARTHTSIHTRARPNARGHATLLSLSRLVCRMGREHLCVSIYINKCIFKKERRSQKKHNLSYLCRCEPRGLIISHGDKLMDSRVADVYPGEDLVAVLRGEAVGAAAGGQQLAELEDRRVRRRRRQLSGTQVLLHLLLLLLFLFLLLFKLMLDNNQLQTREHRPVVQLHFYLSFFFFVFCCVPLLVRSCARCFLVWAALQGVWWWGGSFFFSFCLFASFSPHRRQVRESFIVYFLSTLSE